MAEGTVKKPLIGRRRIIERPRLTRLLDESPARIKMLVAPAGYGKTTLARQWTADAGRKSAWLKVTPAMVDVVSFLAAMARTADQVVVAAGNRMRERLAFTSDPEREWDVLLEILLEDISPAGADAVFVIDDCHLVAESPACVVALEAIAKRVPCEVLLVTRARPEWATARALLYGEVTELGRELLAMSQAEALDALAGVDDVQLAVIELAAGWPAVLGLAAFANPTEGLPLGVDAMPEALYTYLAEELYQGLVPTMRHAVALIALAEVTEAALVSELLRYQDHLVDRACEDGWLHRPTASSVEFHPLLRTFLCSKLEADEPALLNSASIEACDFLLRHGRWDAALRLIRAHRLDDRVPVLLNHLSELLVNGGLTTVRQTVDYASSRGLDEPIIVLAAAEIAYRDGRFFEAETLGHMAANATDDPRLRFEGHFFAGRAAHIGSREEEALTHYRRARELARSPDDLHRTMFGELAAAIDLEYPEAQELLEQLQRDSGADIEKRIMLVGRELSLQARFGLPVRLEEARRSNQLLNRVLDPVARTSFRNVVGYYLASFGAVTEAREVVRAQYEEVDRFKLAFVRGYAEVIEALIGLFEGDLEVCVEIASRVKAAAEAGADGFLAANAVALMTRALVAMGEFSRAIACSAQRVPTSTRSMDGEILASRAVAFACAGRAKDALACADEASEMTLASEVAVLTRCTRAIVASREASDEHFALAENALHAATSLCALEPFISALRGAPELVPVLLEMPETRREMLPLLARANEIERLGGLGPIAETAGTGSWDHLSPREQEVLILVAGGLTNREIGRRLFIAEATVKVHVRHTFEKLGVASRTTAALRVPAFVRTTRL